MRAFSFYLGILCYYICYLRQTGVVVGLYAGRHGIRESLHLSLALLHVAPLYGQLTLGDRPGLSLCLLTLLRVFSGLHRFEQCVIAAVNRIPG